MSEAVEIKQGQTVTFDGVWTPIAGGMASLAGCVVTSAVEDACGNKTYGTVVVAPNNLDFTVSYTAEQTALFALGNMNTDVKFVWSPTVTFTQKGRILVTDHIS